MVWTAEQTGQFLDHAVTDPLYPLLHLITFRGLRRGEALRPALGRPQPRRLAGFMLRRLTAPCDKSNRQAAST